MRAARAGSLVLLLAVAAGGCALKEEVRDVAKDVLTLKRGTISDLKRMRGQGPFTRYEVPPETMLEVVAEACGKARDLAGRPVAIWVSRNYREVTAKERAPDDLHDADYREDWRTAVVVMVHPIEHELGACKVEIHGARRSVLYGGVNDWERTLPGWIDEVMRARAAAVRATASR